MRRLILALALISTAACAGQEGPAPSGQTRLLASSAVPDSPGRLYGIRVEPESNSPAYVRAQYRHWIKVPGTCLNARDAVLAEESGAAITTKTSPNGRCAVMTGSWSDPYTGRTFTVAAQLDIDHFVPLKETHVSGGHAWSPAKKKAYANNLSDPHHLIAVFGPENRRKGDKDPARYLPPNEAYRCQYVAIWIHIKRGWDLSMDEAEAAKVREVKEDCDRRGVAVTLRERPVLPN